MQNRKYLGHSLLAIAFTAILAGCSDGNSSAAPSSTFDQSTGPALSNDGAAASNSLPPEAIPPQNEVGSPIGDEQTSFYFSYDESTSTAARDLSMFAIDNGFRPSPALGRTFEFLNAESFPVFDAQTIGPFSVSMGMLATSSSDIPTQLSTTDSIYALGVNLIGPEQTPEQRRNVVLTLLVDVSGSMDSAYASETRNDIRTLLDVTRYGLAQLPDSLKAGDVVNLVTFSTQASVLFEGENNQSTRYVDSVNSLATEGSTNINAGMQLAYEVANRWYDPQKANRVLIITDAFVNTGEVDPNVIAQQTVINGLEGIYFSGVGVGSSFNDTVLDTLTDVGRGSYSAMISPDDAQRLFTDGFNRFVEPAVTNVRFRLSYPQQLNQFQSAAEEISIDAEDIQPVNFSYNSDQFFLELFTGPEIIDTDQSITLDIEYTNDEGEAIQSSLTLPLEQIYSQGETSIRSAAMVATLANVIAGELSCENAQGSQLYASPVENPVYTRYRGALDTYCSQTPPFSFVTY